MRWILAGLLLSGTVAAAQNPTLQGHPDDYVRADIEYGSRLYAQHCFGCHGARSNRLEVGDGSHPARVAAHRRAEDGHLQAVAERGDGRRAYFDS